MKLVIWGGRDTYPIRENYARSKTKKETIQTVNIMTQYCIWGTTKPFQSLNDFFKAVRNQAFGKSEHSFYDSNLPDSYFNFTWNGGYLVLNFYNVKTNREAHFDTGKKTLSYSLFTNLLEWRIGHYLSELNEYPEPPKETPWFWSLIKWVLVAPFWLLWHILKGVWAILKWLW